MAAIPVVVLGTFSFGLRSPKSPLAPVVQNAVRDFNQRSYFLLEENFQANLSAWSNPALFARRPDGLVELQEGISLYHPSLDHPDYDLSFAGLVRRGSLNWVVRASDAKNHFAFKLTRQAKGRDRRGLLVRYAVVEGSVAAPEKHHISPLPFELDENKPYYIRVSVAGDRVTTIINGRGVDSFSDPRLRTGGIGFFAERGDISLIQELSLTGNNDTPGHTIHWLRGFYVFTTSRFTS